MKANELTIGSWARRRFTYKDTGREVIIDFQVTELRKNGDALYVWGESTDGRRGNMGRIDQIEPIPLTPEILEKNGFEFLYSSVPGGSLQEQRRKKVDTYKWHGLVINYFHENSDFQIMDIRRARFNYVHELQHVLRLCGIEKEIVL